MGKPNSSSIESIVDPPFEKVIVDPPSDPPEPKQLDPFPNEPEIPSHDEEDRDVPRYEKSPEADSSLHHAD